MRRTFMIRRVVASVLVLVIALGVTAGWSYYRTLAAPGTDPWSVRSVEWLKDHGMSGVVTSIEHSWYTNNPPPVGGQPHGGLPRASRPSGNAGVGRNQLAANGPPHLARPQDMRPLVASPLAGEGIWQPTGRTVQGRTAVYTAFFRPDSVHTSLVAGAMWMDTKLLRTTYVAGLQEPGGGAPWGGRVPPAARSSLVAAFNSGFKMADARGGAYLNGQMVRPLVSGAATLVVDKSGRASVGMWGRDLTMSANVASARQNLALIVDNGQPAAGLPSNADGAWGATLGNRVLVWRSGVGVDAQGALVYVAGPGLSASSLAVLLQRAGAVRGMELDINTTWVSAYTYRQVGASPLDVQGVRLLPDMQRSTDRYLTAGERDFFAMFAAR